jgi:hypothetical protein
LFAQERRVELDDGRVLVVRYQGERHGWGAYVPGGAGDPVSADTPADAIVGFLGCGRVPAWVDELSQSLLRSLADPFASEGSDLSA